MDLKSRLNFCGLKDAIKAHGKPIVDYVSVCFKCDSAAAIFMRLQLRISANRRFQFIAKALISVRDKKPKRVGDF